MYIHARACMPRGVVSCNINRAVRLVRLNDYDCYECNNVQIDCACVVKECMHKNVDGCKVVHMLRCAVNPR